MEKKSSEDDNKRKSSGNIVVLFGESVSNKYANVDADGFEKEDFCEGFGDEFRDSDQHRVGRKGKSSSEGRNVRGRKYRTDRNIEKHEQIIIIRLSSGGPTKGSLINIIMDRSKFVTEAKVERCPMEQRNFLEPCFSQLMRLGL